MIPKRATPQSIVPDTVTISGDMRLKGRHLWNRVAAVVPRPGIPDRGRAYLNFGQDSLKERKRLRNETSWAAQLSTYGTDEISGPASASRHAESRSPNSGLPSKLTNRHVLYQAPLGCASQQSDPRGRYRVCAADPAPGRCAVARFPTCRPPSL